MTQLEEFKSEIHRICTILLRVPENKRKDILDRELNELPATQREIALSLVGAGISTMETKSRDFWVAVISGTLFIFILLGIAVFIPDPTSFQTLVFRVVLALGAAGVGAALPGFLVINLPLWAQGTVRAGGALALFIVVYKLNPPELLRDSQMQKTASSYSVPERSTNTVLPTNSASRNP